mmetsp:Transcript_20712/g.79452  ORF Transcript_20712/g.79452 Transcript_20712/m.79452 type:complete len:259 (-) Transcript_20712:2974-3750(-)
MWSGFLGPLRQSTRLPRRAASLVAVMLFDCGSPPLARLRLIGARLQVWLLCDAVSRTPLCGEEQAATVGNDATATTHASRSHPALRPRRTGGLAFQTNGSRASHDCVLHKAHKALRVLPGRDARAAGPHTRQPSPRSLDVLADVVLLEDVDDPEVVDLGAEASVLLHADHGGVARRNTGGRGVFEVVGWRHNWRGRPRPRGRGGSPGGAQARRRMLCPGGSGTGSGSARRCPRRVPAGGAVVPVARVNAAGAGAAVPR